MAAGRPTTYSNDTAALICEQIATSVKSMKTICEEFKLPVRTVLGWLANEDEFQQMYARAKEQQADYMAEDIIEISDHTEEDHTAFTGINVVQRDKLRVEARKWVASKLKPKKYGDKIDLTSDGEKVGNIDYSKLPIEVLNAIIAASTVDASS